MGDYFVQPQSPVLGWWQTNGTPPRRGLAAMRAALLRVSDPLFVFRIEDGIGVSHDGQAVIGDAAPSAEGSYPLLGYVPPLNPGALGDASFRSFYGVDYAYVAGAMANGITSVEMVAAMARAGMLAFFGAAGLLPDQVEAAIVDLKQQLGDKPFGFNLIHSPADPALEAATVRLYLQHGVRLVSASAFMDLTLPVVYYRVKGVRRDVDGRVVCPNRLIAKVSRIEVARKFLAPPPAKLLQRLVETQMITAEEADLAGQVPMADDITAEADSGGHTDNRPAISLLPTMFAVRDEMVAAHRYDRNPGVGLGGGIGTPQATAAAFSMGAAYVLTGTVNQACTEAGTSEAVRRMLAEARQADVTMAPSADMFELGVKVQVLKRGTMFPLRAQKLYDLYVDHDRYESIPQDRRAILERDVFRQPFEAEWRDTCAFFKQRDPRQVERAEKDPKHKMALVFRSYLGQSSHWANTGANDRQIDYQIWCGPTMGAFNDWTRGTFLERLEERRTVTVAMNLLLGAAVISRYNALRSQGIGLPQAVGRFEPLPLDEIAQLLDRKTHPEHRNQEYLSSNTSI